MEYVIFDVSWVDVPKQDYPIGNLAICYDWGKRLGEDTHSVIFVKSEERDDNKVLGLFCDEKEAIRYAESFENIKYEDGELTDECWLCGSEGAKIEIIVECETPNGKTCPEKTVKVHYGCYMDIDA